MSNSTSGGQSPRVNKSVGGRGPIQTKIHTLNNQTYLSKYISVFRSPIDTPKLSPLFSFQIYVTVPTPDSQKEQLCVHLFETITLKRSKPFPPNWRLDIHFLPGKSKDQCISYYLDDKKERRKDKLRVMINYNDESVRTGGVFVLVDHDISADDTAGVVYFDRNMKFLKEGQADGEPEPESEKYFEKVPICGPEGGWTQGTPVPVDMRLWDLYSNGPNEFWEEKLGEAWERGRMEW
ncbi:hypothetical protein VTL71DRAFT_12004 [Oculimacula yallundae]|uniref:Uncharacterized protein n=1 Tax=Oculimacula yallundae TaxID=86028 RepID=A0ABR4CU32_9HELO